MSTKTLKIDHSQQKSIAKIVPRPSLLSSQPAGWQNIHLAQYHLPAGEVPEISSLQHIIVLPFWEQPICVDSIFAGKRYSVDHTPEEVAQNCIEVLPAHVPFSATWNQSGKFIHCYVDPDFITHIAYESVNPDRVDLKLALQKPDPLIWQICLSLKTVLETDPTNSKFYADSMATALAAHFIKYYSTRKHTLQEYEDGLPRYKLKQAFEYIDAHLREDISLADIANELGISQYYFSRLFKQSTGVTPHTYLVQQRVERSKQLLKQKDFTISDIASECGFANPSHFAKWFRKYTGLSPKQFRMM